MVVRLDWTDHRCCQTNVRDELRGRTAGAKAAENCILAFPCAETVTIIALYGTYRCRPTNSQGLPNTMEMQAVGTFDDGGREPYPEDLYDTIGLAEYVPTMADIGPDDVAFFSEHGYLAVEQWLSPGRLDTVVDALMALLDGANPDFKGVVYEKIARDHDLAGMPATRKQDFVRKFWHFVEFHPSLMDLALDPELLGVVKSLIGETPLLFQDMALLKPPRIGREKPWHQDHAYFNYDLDTRVAGVWIALDEATEDNGCMVIVPGSHRKGPVIHFRRRDWQICDTDARQDPPVAVPLPPGGALFFASMLHHGTPTNRSDSRRRAVQFHYCPESARKQAHEKRLQVFGAEGKDVTC